MNRIGVGRLPVTRTAVRTWYVDPEARRFILSRYLPVIAVLNLLWEIAQLPLYTLWTKETPAYIAYSVLHCTVGDVLIALGAVLIALIATRAGSLREWRWTRIGIFAVLSGLAYTVFSEWMNTVLRASWAYSEWMPVLSFLPIGLSPILQWLLVPTAALALARRHAFSPTEPPLTKANSQIEDKIARRP